MNMSDSSEAHLDALDARLSSWHPHSFSYQAPTIPQSEPLIFALDDFEAGSPMGWESTEDHHHSQQHTSSSFLGDVPTIRRPYMASSHASLPSEWLNNTLGSGDTVQFEPCATGPGFALKTEEPSFSWSHWPDRGAFSSSEDLTTSPSADSVTLPSESGSSQPTDIRAMPRMLSYDSDMFGGGSAPAHDRSFGFGQEFGVHPSAISLPSSPWSNHFPKERPTLPINSLFAPQAVRPATFLQQQPLLRSGPQLSPSPVHFVNQTAQYSTASPSAPASGSASETKLRDKSLPVVAESRLRKRKRLEVMEDDAAIKDDAELDPKDKIPLKSELHPPKQAPSTWQVFFTDWLQQHRSRKPADKLNVAQAAKEAGAIYKSLSGEEKEGLKRRAALAKERRERSLAAWQRTLTPEDIKRENRFRAAQRKAGKSRKGNIKDPNAPKKPLSAYFMFLAKIRSSPELVREVFGDEQETTKQSVLAARKWREMSEAQKKPFLSQAEQDKIAYEAARKIYEGHTTGYMHGSSHGAFPSTGAILMTSFTTDAGTENDGDSEGPPDTEEDDTWEDA